MENHRNSKIKRIRKSGFRARQRSTKGRRMNNRKRRMGRTVNVA